jgi:hypothetical protein
VYLWLAVLLGRRFRSFLLRHDLVKCATTREMASDRFSFVSL